MTFDEIFEAGKQGKITVFEGYDLIIHRLEEISEKEKTYDDLKSSQLEIDKLSDLRDYIIKSVFNDYIKSIFDSHPTYSDFIFWGIEKRIFDLEKLKKTDSAESKIEDLKSITKFEIDKTIEFLNQLKEKI